MSERTDAIVKFATVTGVKVTAATKYLTSAIQNGLVGSVQEAMDVLVALGDSAATTAEEISKGMQKAAIILLLSEHPAVVKLWPFKSSRQLILYLRQRKLNL